MKTLEEIKANIRPGWMLNPNEKVVNAIIKGLNRTGGECPCANKYVGTVDAMCPCKCYREEDYCCCTLYIKTDGNKN